MIEDVTAARCVDFAVQIEEAGAQLYQALAARFEADKELESVFRGLGRDEVHHREQFRALQARALAPSQERPLSDAQKTYLRAMSLADVFSTTRSLATDLAAIRTREDALERALGLEKATLAFYQAMRDVLGSDEILEALIEVEKSHVVKVMELMITGARFRGLGDRF
jgi:rubrerythrin